MSELAIYTDGSTRPTNPGPSGYGASLYRDGEQIATINGYLGDSITNNQAEYAALVMGLVAAEELLEPDDHLVFRTDSKLVVYQVNGEWRLGAGKLYPLYQRACVLIDGFREEGIEVTLEHVKGHVGIVGNEAADRLAGHAVARQDPPPMWLAALLTGEAKKVAMPTKMMAPLKIIDPVKKTELPPLRGHEKLRDLITTNLRERGHQVINIYSSELARYRDVLKRTNEITGSTIASFPELAIIIHGTTYLLSLATGYRVDHGNPGVLTMHKEAFDACRVLSKGGLHVLVVHKPHGSGQWKRYSDLRWSESSDEIAASCFEISELPTNEGYNTGAWPSSVTLSQDYAKSFSQYVKDAEQCTSKS